MIYEDGGPKPTLDVHTEDLELVCRVLASPLDSWFAGRVERLAQRALGMSI